MAKNIFQWGNPGERLSQCVEGVEIYTINLKKKKNLRISKVSCKESSRSESLIDCLIYFLKYSWVRKTKKCIRNAIYLKILMPNDA